MENNNARIEISTPDGESQTFLLDQPVHILGRGEKCDIHIDNNTLSRVHARIFIGSGGEYRICDEGSHNGVFFRGHLLKTDQEMVPGEIYQLGDVSLVLTLGEGGESGDAMTVLLPPKRPTPEGRPLDQTAPPSPPVSPPSAPPPPPIVMPVHPLPPVTALHSSPSIPEAPAQSAELDHEGRTILFDGGQSEFILEIVAGAHVGASQEFSGKAVVIGRSLECDFVLDDATVSRKHAMIYREGDAHLITVQKGSESKLYVNGEACDQRTLQHKDRIRLGKTQMIFRLKNAPEEASVASAVQPKVEVRIEAPAAARSSVTGYLLVALLLGGAAVGWMDPWHWFPSKLSVHLEELARTEREGQYYKVLPKYEEMLANEKDLTPDQKGLIREKYGLAHLEQGASLLDGGNVPDALTHFRKSLDILTGGDANTAQGVEGRMTGLLLKYAGRMMDKGEDQRGGLVMTWVGENIPSVKELHDFKILTERIGQFEKARQVRGEAMALAAKGDAEGASRLLERCMLELASAGEPCLSGRKELARNGYDQAQIQLQSVEAGTSKNKGKLLEGVERLLEQASHLDPQVALYRDALVEVQRKKAVYQSRETVDLFQGEGSVVDKFRR